VNVGLWQLRSRLVNPAIVGVAFLEKIAIVKFVFDDRVGCSVVVMRLSVGATQSNGGLRGIHASTSVESLHADR
jgi:hypothetical protein